MARFEIHAKNGAGETFTLCRDKHEFIPLSRPIEQRCREKDAETLQPYLSAVKSRGAVSGIYNARIVTVEA